MKNKAGILLIFGVLSLFLLSGCAVKGAFDSESEDITGVFSDMPATTPDNAEQTGECPEIDENAADYISKPTVPFGYNKLNKEQKSLYRSLEDGTVTEENPFAFTGDAEKDDEYVNALLLYEHNTYRVSSWQAKAYRIQYDDEGIERVAIVPSEGFYNDGKDKIMAENFTKAVSEILTKLPPDTEKDCVKIKAIADLLCESITYNYGATMGGHDATAEEFEIERYASQDYGALVNNSAICSGYSSAFQYLCEKLGVYSIYVIGEAGGNREAHAWNIVYLDGAYYHVDVTWMDSGDTINYDYFLRTAEEISKDHYNIRYSDLANPPEITALFELP